MADIHRRLERVRSTLKKEGQLNESDLNWLISEVDRAGTVESDRNILRGKLEERETEVARLRDQLFVETNNHETETIRADHLEKRNNALAALVLELETALIANEMNAYNGALAKVAAARAEGLL